MRKCDCVAPGSHFLRLSRPHQWTKNLLIFIPLITAHRFRDTEAVLSTIVAFIAFSLCASAVYVVNDWFDRVADHDHPTKRNRPIASSEVHGGKALIFAAILVASSLGITYVRLRFFLPVLAFYLIITTLYSTMFKRWVLFDVVVLALLYTLRVFAGAVAAGVELSEWLLVFSMFLFSSLALVKRYAELSSGNGLGEKHRRGYKREDLVPVLVLGISTGALAVLVMALYVTSDRVRGLYHHPQVLWLICPLILYWIGRVWILANRGEMKDDPVIFALRDGASYVVGALSFFIMWMAI